MDNISRFQKTTGVGQILDESFARCPEREAIVYEDWRLTYGDLERYIRQTAHYLRHLGSCRHSSTGRRTACAVSALRRATASPSSRATARRS